MLLLCFILTANVHSWRASLIAHGNELFLFFSRGFTINIFLVVLLGTQESVVIAKVSYSELDLCIRFQLSEKQVNLLLLSLFRLYFNLLDRAFVSQSSCIRDFR